MVSLTSTLHHGHNQRSCDHCAGNVDENAFMDMNGSFDDLVDDIFVFSLRFAMRDIVVLGSGGCGCIPSLGVFQKLDKFCA